MLWDALGCSGDALGRRFLGFSYAIKQSRARETNFKHKLIEKNVIFSDRLLRHLELWGDTMFGVAGRPWDEKF